MSARPAAPQITVAVPVKDRRERMLRCLESLLGQDHPNYEVIVLDNESSDGTAEACAELAAGASVPVRVEVLPGTVGAMRNRAAELARGEFLAFTDSDCLADPAWLSTAVAAFQDSPRTGVVCGATLPLEPPTAGWPATIEVTGWTGHFESCNVIFRTVALRASRGFDEEVGHYWEDTAAGYAVLSDGWEARFAAQAVIRHDVTYPGFAWHLQRAMKHRNAGPVLARYPELARDLLWAGVFLSPRDAKLIAAGAGLLLTRRYPAALALSVPYVRERLLARWWEDPKGLAQTVLYDAANVLGALRASPRARRLVL